MKIKTLIGVVATFVVFPSSFVMACANVAIVSVPGNVSSSNISVVRTTSDQQTLKGGGVMNTIIGVNVISNQQAVSDSGNVAVAGSGIDFILSGGYIITDQGQNDAEATVGGFSNVGVATAGAGNITAAGSGINFNGSSINVLSNQLDNNITDTRVSGTNNTLTD